MNVQYSDPMVDSRLCLNFRSSNLLNRVQAHNMREICDFMIFFLLMYVIKSLSSTQIKVRDLELIGNLLREISNLFIL